MNCERWDYLLYAMSPTAVHDSGEVGKRKKFDGKHGVACSTSPFFSNGRWAASSISTLSS